MRAKLLVLATVLVAASTVSAQQTMVFTNGTRMAIQGYEVKGNLVLITTAEGKLRSMPLSLVDVPATERLNGSARPEPAAPPPPPPAPAASPRPEPEPVQPEPEPMSQREPEREPMPEPAPIPEPEPIMDRDMPSGPPPAAPVWANEELKVSVQVPSPQWHFEDMPPSFDVAVAIENPTAEAKATLALIREELRGRNDFRRVVSRIESTISQADGFQSLGAGEVDLAPYHAHEFRFVKNVELSPVYSRIVVVYSRDMAYVLSMICPEARAAENENDFESFARGLVIKKSPSELDY